MYTLFKISWRNIWRSKVRSLVIMGAVAFGLWMGIFLIGFYTGLINQRMEQAIASELSHLQIHHPDFKNDYDVKFVIPKGLVMLQDLKKRQEVKIATGRIITRGMIASAAGSSGITINGVSPKEEDSITGLKGKLIAGHYFNNDKKSQIIISEKLANRLKLKLNKKTILTFQNSNGDLVSSAFRIAGLYRTVNGPYDDVNVFIPIEEASNLAGISGAYNELAVLLNNNNDLPGVIGHLKSTYPDVKVMPWHEIAPELGLTMSVGNQMVYIFMGIIFFALAFGIVNTMLMSILERSRELGVLMAVGMNKFRIFTMILLETIMLTVAGCPLGMGLGYLTILITHTYGISLRSFESVYSTFGYSREVFPELQLSQIWIIILLVLLTAVVSALFPAFKAMRINPASSLKK